MTIRIPVAAVSAFSILVALAALGRPVAAQDAATPTTLADGTTVVWVVRHAERDDASPAMADPGDPPLSSAGEERARALARILGDLPLATVFTTPFERTRSTAAPVAAAHGLVPVEYDPRVPGETAALIRTLRTTPGHHLVVGHSNTTPEMVAALGADPGPPIEEWEYDRLYAVVLGPDGTVGAVIRLRFGTPSEPIEAGHR